MAREQKTATFGKRAGENNRKYSQTLAKEGLGRSFAREHQGNGIADQTAWAAERTTKNWLKQDPEKQLRWLANIREKRRENRGIVPRWVYEDLSDAYYHIAGVHVQIASNTLASDILDELFSETLERVSLLEEEREMAELARYETEARKEVAWCKAEWQEAVGILEKLKTKRLITGADLLTLLHTYQKMYGHESEQAFLLELRFSANKIDTLIPMAEAVVQHLKQVLDDTLESAQEAYPGLYSYRSNQF